MMITNEIIYNRNYYENIFFGENIKNDIKCFRNTYEHIFYKFIYI